MAFLKVTNRRPKNGKGSRPVKEKGIVYIIKMWVGDKDDLQLVYKIGVTTRKIEVRLLELAASHFTVFRYMPMMDVRKFTKTSCYFGMEAELHELYKEYRYYSKTEWDGHTELFAGIDEAELIERYEELISKYSDKKTPRAKKVREEIDLSCPGM